MTLENWADVSQVVGAAAVVASLLFVGVQLRQNTRAQLTLSVQSLTAAIAAINVPAMESPALGLALSRVCADWSKAGRDDRVIAHYFLFSFFKLCEQAWFQHGSGALDRGQWAGWENSLLRFYHSPGVKAGWWPHRRGAYSPSFQAFLAASAPPPIAASLYDLFDGAPTIQDRTNDA